MTARCFLPAPAPTIALAVHRSTDLGTPEHKIGQTLIEGQVRKAFRPTATTQKEES
jgi:hypothetical protein